MFKQRKILIKVNTICGSFFLGCGHLITVTVPEKFVNVTNGESALLQCTFVTTVQNTSNIIIQWSFVAKTSNVLQQVCRLTLLCLMLPPGHGLCVPNVTWTVLHT